MKNDIISLHPRHGVNPTLLKCLVCGEDTGEIALLGFNKGKKAPKYTRTDTLCNTCKEITKTYVIAMESTSEKVSDITGRFVKIKLKIAEEMFDRKFPVDSRVILSTKELFEQFIKAAK